MHTDQASGVPAVVPIGAGMITLTLKEPVELVPLEAEALCPDTMATLEQRRDPRAAGLPGQEAVPHRRLLHG